MRTSPCSKFLMHHSPLVHRPTTGRLGGNGLLTIFREMPIFVVDLAFEGELFVIQLLHVFPVVQGDEHNFRDAFLKINFNI